MRRVLKILAVAAMVAGPTQALSDIYNDAANAYRDLAYALQQLPDGTCGANGNQPPIRPYREALFALQRFEQVAASISNKPDLSQHRAVLTDIVDHGYSPCKDPYAGVSFRCNGPCPPRSFEYVEAPDLPEFEVARAQPRDNQNNRPSKLDGWSVNRAVFDNGGWIEKLSNGDWYEFNRQGKRIFRFEEMQRDDWSVYLNDRSRNVQLQVDLHRKWISYGEDFGPRRDLYRIIDAEAR